jgi:hypothetical protein
VVEKFELDGEGVDGKVLARKAGETGGDLKAEAGQLALKLGELVFVEVGVGIGLVMEVGDATEEDAELTDVVDVAELRVGAEGEFREVGEQVAGGVIKMLESSVNKK